MRKAEEILFYCNQKEDSVIHSAESGITDIGTPRVRTHNATSKKFSKKFRMDSLYHKKLNFQPIKLILLKLSLFFKGFPFFSRHFFRKEKLDKLKNAAYNKYMNMCSYVYCFTGRLLHL